MKPVAPNRPCFTIFGGPNGSGKSTAYDRFVRAGFDPGEYLNPDEVAKSASESGTGGSAFDIRAGRDVLERTRSLIDARRSFVRESTLTGREIVRTAERAKGAGYRLVLVFVAVPRPPRRVDGSLFALRKEATTYQSTRKRDASPARSTTCGGWCALSM